MKYNKLSLGDARQLDVFFPYKDPMVDLILTSPPYWDMKEYGKIPNQIGYGQSREEYLHDLKIVLEGCFRITKDTGLLWLIADTFRRDGNLELLPFDLGLLAKSVGWRLRNLIIWDKQYCLPWHQKGQMRNTSEFILMFSKSDNYKFYIDRIKDVDEISRWWVDFPERFNPKGKTPTNIWHFPIRRRGTWPDPSIINHFCPFPTGLVARIIELTTDPGDFVFDPFAGSGIVLAQAAQMNRVFFGLEVNPDYILIYENSVKKAVAEEWKEIKKQRQSFEGATRDFEQTIMRLRALKYSRQAIKAFVESLQSSELSKVLCAICLADIPSNFDRANKIKIEIWFIGEKNHMFMRKGLVITEKRLSRAPLSHFGISSTLASGNLNKFLKTREHLNRKKFFLYPNQRIREFSSADVLVNWFQDNKILKSRNGNLLPLLSNLEVNVSWAVD